MLADGTWRDLVQTGASGERHGGAELLLEECEEMVDAAFASDRKREKKGLANPDGRGAQGERLDNVGASPHARVQEDGGASGDRSDDRREHVLNT